MVHSKTDSEIRACVERFVAELHTLVQKATVESVLEAVSGSTWAPARRGPGRPRKTGLGAKPGKRIRRSTSAVDKSGDAALSYVAANPNCSVGEIGAALGMSTKDLRLPLQKLLSEGKVKTSGQKRGTRYHAGSGKKAEPKKRVVKKRAAKKKASSKK